MKVIKFRAWDKKEKRIWSWDELLDTEKPLEILTPELRWLAAYNIMQYTGLKDKNDKEIYEGDVVKGWGNFNHADYPSDEIQTGVAEFIGSQFIIKNISKHCRGIDIKLWYNLERIGNIYENPELIKV